MPNAKKLPSGNWRVMIDAGKSPAGKRHRKSFTAATKREAEYMAAQYAAEKHMDASDHTIGSAVEQYISDREGLKSPTTIRGYRQIQKRYLGAIEDIKIDSVKKNDIQIWIKFLSSSLSPKTVRNIYSLVISSIQAVSPSTRINVTLPNKMPIQRNVPTRNDIQIMLAHSSGNLKKGIELAAFGSLRRGEVCALRYADLKKNIIHVHSDMVKDDSGNWTIKNIPKNLNSIRNVPLPEFVIQDLLLPANDKESDSEYIVSCNPQTLYVRFHSLMKKLNMPYRFHDLRIFFASYCHSKNIPNQYIQKWGGWKNDNILNEVYRQTMQDAEDEFSNMIINNFNSDFD